MAVTTELHYLLRLIIGKFKLSPVYSRRHAQGLEYPPKQTGPEGRPPEKSLKILSLKIPFSCIFYVKLRFASLIVYKTADFTSVHFAYYFAHYFSYYRMTNEQNNF